MIRITVPMSDAAWLNRQIEDKLDKHTFTQEQEEAIKLTILEIAYGYRHTISRQEWGPGWD